MRIKLLAILSIGLLPFLEVVAEAGDGVLEISQTCAVNTGCFTGDSAGFPVTISSPGSYVLTSGLRVPDENTIGILIETSNVGIDLNNFGISRVNCGSDTICSSAGGTGIGILQVNESSLPSLPTEGVSVANGSIFGMDGMGVLLLQGADVRNLHVRYCFGGGISASTGIISGNTLSSVGGTGIVMGIGAVSDNTIEMGGPLYPNGPFTGIFMTIGRVSDNSILVPGTTGNIGVRANGTSLVSGNSVFINGVTGSLGQGIVFDGPPPFQTGGYRDNVISTPGGGATVVGGVDMGNNLCNGTTTCP